MAIPSDQDFDDAARDLVTVSDVANLANPTTVTRLGDTIPTLAGITGSLSSASGRAFTSKPQMDAQPGTVENQAARVTEGPDKGLYLWVAGVWTRTEDPLDAAVEIAKRNGLTIGGDVTKLRFISSGVNANAVVADIEPITLGFGAGGGFVTVAAATDLMIPLNQALIIDLREVDPLTGPTVTAEITTVDPSSASYGEGAFITDKRFILLHNRSSNNTLRVGGLLSTKMENYSTGDSWVFTAASGAVSYDDATRTISSNTLMFCPFQANKSNRINLPAFSIQLPDTTYQWVWIDKSMIPADGGNLPMAAIKIGGYNADAETDYQSMPHQLGIFYRARAGQYGPIKGFPAPNPPPPVPVTPTTGLSFVKQAASASIYFDGAGSKKIEIPFKHEVVPYDGVSDDSQKDNWRFFEGYETDANRVRGNKIMSSGEVEMAIRISGDGDAVGGYHGDELLTDATFFVNGSPKAQTDTVALANVKSVGLIQNSYVYKENVEADMDAETGQQTGLNAAIKHHKDYSISADDGYIALRQRAEFLQDLSLVSAWTTLIPILRYMNITSGPLITDRVMRSRNGVIQDISTWVDGSTPETLEVREGDRYLIYGTISGICLEIIIDQLPRRPDGSLVGNPKMYISTNTSAYNKFYNNLRGASAEGDPNIDVVAGDVWLWKTRFKFTTSN